MDQIQNRTDTETNCEVVGGVGKRKGKEEEEGCEKCSPINKAHIKQMKVRGSKRKCEV